MATAKTKAAVSTGSAETPAVQTVDPAQGIQVIEDAVSKGRNAVQQVMDQGASSAQAAIGKATALFRDNAEKTQAQLNKGYEEFSSLSRGNFDAVIESGSLFAQGAGSLNRASLDLAQKQIESAFGAAKAMASAKTVNELVSVQTDYMRGTVDTLIVESTRMAELGNKLAQDVTQPFHARMAAAWDKAGKSLAA